MGSKAIILARVYCVLGTVLVAGKQRWMEWFAVKCWVQVTETQLKVAAAEKGSAVAQ